MQGWKLGWVAACLACGAFACSGSSSSPTPDASTDATTCSNGALACGSACVDPQTDPANCGACGTSCNATEVCASGQCRSTCLADQSKCETDAGAYCADTKTDNANCGACGNACGVGQVCASGKCGSTCDTGQSLCQPDGGAPYCATTDTDNANCGSCGHACGAGEVCSGGHCGSTCSGAQTLCDAGDAGDASAPYCASLQTDNANCGACGAPCGAGETCISGTCKVGCAQSLTACGDTCVDTTSDPSHCGSCNNACASGQTCQQGRCGNLVAYWPFDPLGSTADATGHGYDAVNSGATGAVAYARDGFSFDGTSSMTAPNLDAVFAGGSFTVEAWINMPTVPGADDPILLSCNPAQDECIHMIVRSGHPFFGFYLDDLQSSTTLAASTWYHLAFTYDASTKTQSIFVNGVADSSRTSNAYLGSGGKPTILGGAPPWQTAGFDGTLDEVKVYDFVRSSADILDDASSLVKLPFDGNLLEVGPNHLWTTATGQAFVTGEHGQGLAFDGSTTLFQAWNMATFAVTDQPFSLEAWIDPTDTSDAVLFHASTASDGSGSCVPYLGFYGGKLIARVWNGNGDISVTAPTTPSTGIWSHVAETWSSSSGLELYVNGSKVASATAAHNYTYVEPYLTLGSPLPVACGGGNRPTGHYHGVMDDVRVYSRVRTDAEIASDATP